MYNINNPILDYNQYYSEYYHPYLDSHHKSEQYLHDQQVSDKTLRSVPKIEKEKGQKNNT